MTAIRRDGREDPFNAWVRNHPDMRSHDGIVFTDRDLIVHRYKTYVQPFYRGCPDTLTRNLQHFMIVEVKTFGADLSSSQQDTLDKLDHILRQSKRTEYQCRWQGLTVLRMHGVHVLRMAGSCPGDSEWIRWDGKEIDAKQIVELFWFRLSPDTLRPRDDRLHHAKRMPLFESAS